MYWSALVQMHFGFECSESVPLSRLVKSISSISGLNVYNKCIILSYAFIYLIKNTIKNILI